MTVQVEKPRQSQTPWFFLISFIVTISVAIFFLLHHTPSTETLTREEREYFLALYQDTWNYLANHVEEGTGLPYDSSAKQPPTSMSNVGLYLASTAIAYRTGLIPKDDALRRTVKCLGSLEQVETWRGFPRPWILVRNLKPTHGDEFSYGPHIANLLGGLVVAKTSFPELASRASQLIEKMDFKSLYETKNGWLKGGYNVKTQNFAVYQSWGHWYYKYFAAETRLLSFYLIASKIVPTKHWFSLIRPLQKKEGERFFVPGPEESGLSTQYVTGLFLDERETEMGRSQKSYARAQMKYAKRMGAPVWGWSAAEAPNGTYLAAGELKDEIVTPYASILASIYFPKQVYDNLKELEKMGARPVVEGSNQGFGFLDSADWKTGALARNYLTPHQGMAFLSLANLLFDGIVWESFSEDAVAESGFEIL